MCFEQLSILRQQLSANHGYLLTYAFMYGLRWSVWIIEVFGYGSCCVFLWSSVCRDWPVLHYWSLPTSKICQEHYRQKRSKRWVLHVVITLRINKLCRSVLTFKQCLENRQTYKLGWWQVVPDAIEHIFISGNWHMVVHSTWSLC